MMYKAIIVEIRAHCTTQLNRVMASESPIDAYASVFAAYVVAMRRISSTAFFYLNKKLKEEFVVGDRDVNDTAMVIWRDIVLRGCIDKLVQDATTGGSADHGAAVLELSKKTFDYDGIDITTFTDLKKHLEGEGLRFEHNVSRLAPLQVNDLSGAGGASPSRQPTERDLLNDPQYLLQEIDALFKVVSLSLSLSPYRNARSLATVRHSCHHVCAPSFIPPSLPSALVLVAARVVVNGRFWAPRAFTRSSVCFHGGQINISL
jgi:hypothetical protein